MASVSFSRALAGGAAFALLFALAVPKARATVYASKQEALREAFADADRIEEKSFVLTTEQARSIEALAAAPLERQIWTLYLAYREDRLIGSAVIDVRNVRTLPEALSHELRPQWSALRELGKDEFELDAIQRLIALEQLRGSRGA